MSSLSPNASWMTTTPGHGPSPTGGVATNAGWPFNEVSGIGLDQDFQTARRGQVLEGVAGAFQTKRAGHDRLGLDLAAGDQVDRPLPVADRTEHADQFDVVDDHPVEVEGDRR